MSGYSLLRRSFDQALGGDVDVRDGVAGALEPDLPHVPESPEEQVAGLAGRHARHLERAPAVDALRDGVQGHWFV